MAYTTTTQQLFANVVPAFVQSTNVAVGGAVLFDIEGMNGGTWVVDFQAKSVTEGPAKGQLKAIVRAGERDFMALVEGRMSADDGLLTQRLHVAGDAAAIAHLMDAFTQLRATLPR